MRNRLVITAAVLVLGLPLLTRAVPSPAAKLDAASAKFYHMARYFMTRDEEKRFHNLATPELRRQFIEAFWEIRDPDPGTAENEFRDELEDRFDFVNRYLREANRPGWDTARGMVYLVLGPPDSITAGSTPYPSASPLNRDSRSDTTTGIVVWPYQMLSVYVYFVDRQGFGIYELDMVRTSPRLIALLKTSKTRFIRDGVQAVEEPFLDFKARFEPASDRVRIAIAAKDLRYDIDPSGGYTARIHLAANLYQNDGSIVTRKDERRISFDPRTQKKEWLEIEWTIPLAKGKNQVDLLVLDQVGGRSNRLFLSVKKK